MSRSLTVVYTINDEDGFKLEMANIMSKFMQSKGKPWAITAMSHGHDLHRLYLVEGACSEERYDLLQNIIGMAGGSLPTEISDLSGY